MPQISSIIASSVSQFESGVAISPNRANYMNWAVDNPHPSVPRSNRIPNLQVGFTYDLDHMSAWNPVIVTKAKMRSKATIVLSEFPSSEIRIRKCGDLKLMDEFNALADAWAEETSHLSSPISITSNWNYLRAISLGSKVVPLMLARMQENDEDWFTALSAITGEDPIPENHYGQIELMISDWVEWATARGISLD